MSNLETFFFHRPKQEARGFTLMEILIVVAIIAILVTMGVTNWRTQTMRAADSRKKTDLAKLKRAFEEYYNDHGCFPPLVFFDSANDCASGQLAPYLPAIPCDGSTGLPYNYQPTGGDPCSGYRLFTSLGDKKDPDIARLRCDGPNACGYGVNWNYGVSSGASVSLY